MNKPVPSDEKISEALKLLEEAASEKKEEIKNLVNQKYQGLKELMSEAGDKIGEMKKKAIEAAIKAKDVTWEKSKVAATAVDENVHQNPWYYIGAAAIGGLLLGYILGKKNND